MSHRTKFLMIGGFLGAGKTTAIGRLARMLRDLGKRVAVVTNDQAFNLVDTHSLRSQGLDVGEVPGACFCCKFDDLVETAAKLGAEGQPDVILAEPVGSCTDLAATVIEPLRSLYGDRYDVGKLAVLCKPEHGAKILGANPSQSSIGFSPKAAYIFLKQLEEADVVVVNKTDKLRPDQALKLATLVRRRTPNKEVLLASGKTGQGFDALLKSLEGEPAPRERFMELDYDTYAAGEAELAWLNATVDARSTDDSHFHLDEVVLTVVQRVAENLVQANYEPAHLKVLGYASGETSVANLVAADAPPELSLPARVQCASATLIVNARVSGDPEVLAAIIQEALAQQGASGRLACRVTASQHFRPGRPEPTHRFG